MDKQAKKQKTKHKLKETCPKERQIKGKHGSKLRSPHQGQTV
jgi:hypothetical protein